MIKRHNIAIPRDRRSSFSIAPQREPEEAKITSA